MGSMFRSEEMVLCQIFIQSEVAYATVSELGEAGCVQFRDLNKDVTTFQRKLVSEVRRCDEMDRKIRFIESVIKENGLKLPSSPTEIPRAPEIKEICNLEVILDKSESEILELTENKTKLQSAFKELTERRKVLEVVELFFTEQEVVNLNSVRFSLQAVEQNFSRLNFIAGVIDPQRQYSFARMLWRIASGKAYVKSDLQFYIRDKKTGVKTFKNVFMIFFQGEQLRNRVLKVCNGFHAKIYECPNTFENRLKMLNQLTDSLRDLETIIHETEEHLTRVIKHVKKNVLTWKIAVMKSKAIFHTLNKFNINIARNCLVGECWVPINDLPVVQKALTDGRADDSVVASFLNIIETNEFPPTFNRTNKFTQGFQNLIDAYGVASYCEANPALYTIITFPFLFAVMFGDFGHGFILFLFGAWMCLWERGLEKKRAGEIWNIFFGGRYIILLMGIFSMYTGFVYNDVFSKSIKIFHSTWTINYNSSTVPLDSKVKLQLDPKYASFGTYPIGMDPIWQLAENKIIFLNTYKMKLSIIFGVIHMFFGVCMSVVNFSYFKKRVSIFLEFLPQILFLTLLFGYMVFMMFFKWVKYSAKSEIQANTPGCAPSVLIMFINMMLFKSTEPLKGCNEFMFSAQKSIQTAFIAIGLVCIPWMLLGKPLYIKCTRKPRQGNTTNYTTIDDSDIDTLVDVSSDEQIINIPDDNDGHSDTDGDDENSLLANTSTEHIRIHSENNEDDEEEQLSEVFIHQAIHTIEYVLSTISHTASYLRLWALSLAHAQLSEVLWSMVLSLALHSTSKAGFIMIYIIFAIWAMFTLAILVMMEGLSAFLHTLRLHWVEFMSKFYSGLGYAFDPFSFKKMLKEDE